MSCCGRDNPNSKRVYPPEMQRMTGAVVAFELVKMDGTTQTFGSRLEADAENARSGYNGVVRPVT